jgi:hypothetical protein
VGIKEDDKIGKKGRGNAQTNGPKWRRRGIDSIQ